MGKMIYRCWHWFMGKASIRRKLIISFAILVSIPIVILGVYSFHVSNRNLLEQTKKTVDNNLGRLVMEMEARFGRETDFTKFLAYHLSFRETLEKNPFDNVAIAQELNKTGEPIFWYFISSDANKISLIFSIADKTGSLYRVLGRFSMAGLNLTKLESRPIENENFNYHFYVDVSGSVKQQSALDLMCALYDELPEFEFLGNFNEG